MRQPACDFCQFGERRPLLAEEQRKDHRRFGCAMWLGCRLRDLDPMLFDADRGTTSCRDEDAVMHVVFHVRDGIVVHGGSRFGPAASDQRGDRAADRRRVGDAVGQRKEAPVLTPRGVSE